MKAQAHIGLTDPKSPDNVGAVMRAAGCYNAASVSYTGHRFNKATARGQKLHTDTKNVARRISLNHIEDFKSALPAGAVPVAIELVEGATSLVDYQHPDNAFYIFGPEDKSLTKDVVAWCTDVIYIPTVGCMNLAATVNVVLYDRLAKLGAEREGDELILASRDNNNRLKV
ncbi:MAG: RNA methyltransferase [Psychrobium sp.]|nr:RNA methyltransferase [Psychrobium sp.]